MFTADQFNAVITRFDLTKCDIEQINQCDWGVLRDKLFKQGVVSNVEALKQKGNRLESSMNTSNSSKRYMRF